LREYWSLRLIQLYRYINERYIILITSNSQLHMFILSLFLIRCRGDRVFVVTVIVDGGRNIPSDGSAPLLVLPVAGCLSLLSSFFFSIFSLVLFLFAFVLELLIICVVRPPGGSGQRIQFLRIARCPLQSCSSGEG
jgi:hypothetical protein